MDVLIEGAGDVVERQELLNGTQIVTLEGAGGGWTLTSLVTWNIGLEERDAEGDITLARGADEVFATLTRVVAGEGAADDAPLDGGGDGDERLAVVFEIDGGTGAFEGASGRVSGELVVSGATFRFRLSVAAEGSE